MPTENTLKIRASDSKYQMQKIKYRLNYLLRRIALGFGICPRCWHHMNYTTTGRPICPNCGR